MRRSFYFAGNEAMAAACWLNAVYGAACLMKQGKLDALTGKGRPAAVLRQTVSGVIAVADTANQTFQRRNHCGQKPIWALM